MTLCLEIQADDTLTSSVVFGMVRVYTPLWVLPDLKMAAQSVKVVGVSCIMPVFISVGESKKYILLFLHNGKSRPIFLCFEIRAPYDWLHFLCSLWMDSMEYVNLKKKEKR